MNGAASLVLAFDFGLRAIGVAAGQTITRTASPVTTLPAKDGVPDWQAVAMLIREWHPVRLLVGLPLNMDGTPSEMGERAEQFAERLHTRTALEVILVDERLSSFEAKHLSADADRRHAVAACLIAETYFNAGS